MMERLRRQLYQREVKMKVVLAAVVILSAVACISCAALHLLPKEQHEIDKEIKIGIQKRFHIAGHITITVMNSTVDIRKCDGDLPSREGITYTLQQWKKFVELIPKVERNMGIYRVGTKSVVITVQEPMKIQLMALFNGCPSIKGIAVTLKQWFQIVNLVPQIDRIIKAD